MSGKSDLSTRGYFTPFPLSVITAKEVTSDPVPLVVGTAINSISGKSPICFEKCMIAFASSIAEPPPRAIRVSGLYAMTSFTPSTTSSSGGSGTTLLKILYSFSFNCSVIRSTIFDSTINGSVTIKIRVAVRLFRQFRASAPKHTAVCILNSSMFHHPFKSFPYLAIFCEMRQDYTKKIKIVVFPCIFITFR